MAADSADLKTPSRLFSAGILPEPSTPVRAFEATRAFRLPNSPCLTTRRRRLALSWRFEGGVFKLAAAGITCPSAVHWPASGRRADF